jgi:uncharacterized protein YoxC
MVTVAEMAQWFRKAFDETQSQLLAEATARLHEDLVHREDFTKLTAIVDRLADRTDRMAAAQERSDGRLDELAIAQTETQRNLAALALETKDLSREVKELSHEVKELSQETKELSQEVKELSQETKELSHEVKGLSQETKELSRETKGLAHDMKGLSRGMKDTRRQVGGLAQTVGYGLEAYAMDKIPQLLANTLTLVVQSSKPEQFTAADGTDDEIDMVVRGSLAGKPVVFLCEVKTNITAKEVTDFLPIADRVGPQAGCDDVRMLYFAYRAGTQARQAVRDAGAYLAFPHALIVQPAD